VISRWIALAALILTAQPRATAEDLFSAMAHANFASVLLLQSQSVDEHPIWSPKQDALAVNIEGKWMSLPFGSVTLAEGKWHDGRPIGVLKTAAVMSPLDEKTVQGWEKSGRYDPRRVETRDGTVAELKPDELSTEFLITRKGAKPESQWKSEMENCHSLGLSPDENYVAYICELNGVVVTRLTER